MANLFGALPSLLCAMAKKISSTAMHEGAMTMKFSSLAQFFCAMTKKISSTPLFFLVP